MCEVFKNVLQLLPVAEFLDQHIVWQSAAEFSQTETYSQIFMAFTGHIIQTTS
jgi:hypothetical protein